MPVFNLKSGSRQSSGWKSERQKLQVLGRLAAAGISVSDDTPPSEAWALMTQLLVDECAGRRPAKSPKINLPPLPKRKTGFADWTPTTHLSEEDDDDDDSDS